MEVAAGWVHATSLGQPSAMMTLVVAAGLLCGAITQWLGVILFEGPNYNLRVVGATEIGDAGIGFR